MTNQPTTPTGALQAEISKAIVRLYSDFIGRGPTRARTIYHDDTVVVILSDLLLKAERRLIEDDRGEVVLSMRHTFQMTMRSELISAVETLTGRKVIGFMSGNQTDPDMACEVFVLAEPDPI